MQTVLSQLFILSILYIWGFVDFTFWKIMREEEYEITKEDEKK